MKPTLFTVLFYLGCANEIYIANPRITEISKHNRNHRRKVTSKNRVKIYDEM